MDQILVLFDGSNQITRRNRNGEKIAEKVKLQAVQKYSEDLKRKYRIINPIIFIDNSLPRYIDNPEWLWKQIDSWKIIKCEKGHEVDEYLIGFLQIAPLKTKIISNDQFRNYKAKIPKICGKIKWRFESRFRGQRLIIPEIKEYLQFSTLISNSPALYGDMSLSLLNLAYILEV
ncbi:MAG: hypothetical protein ACFFG0_42750 [Candidatus Thorarchaeota archaeon]